MRFDGPEPLYARIERQVRALIGRGAWPAGSRLPSVRETADRLRVSALTVLRAYRELAREGFLETRPGAGFYVRGRPGRPTARGRREVAEALRGAIETAAGYGIGRRAFLSLAKKLLGGGKVQRPSVNFPVASSRGAGSRSFSRTISKTSKA